MTAQESGALTQKVLVELTQEQARIDALEAKGAISAVDAQATREISVEKAAAELARITAMTQGRDITKSRIQKDGKLAVYSGHAVTGYQFMRTLAKAEELTALVKPELAKEVRAVEREIRERGAKNGETKRITDYFVGALHIGYQAEHVGAFLEYFGVNGKPVPVAANGNGHANAKREKVAQAL